MRVVVAILVLLACLACSGASPPEPPPSADAQDPEPFLTEKQRRIICSRTLDMCADVWCEGPLDFRFEDIRCPGDGDCTVHVRYRPWLGGRRHGWKPARCTISDVHSVEDIGQDALTAHYFLQLQDCLNELSAPFQ